MGKNDFDIDFDFDDEDAFDDDYDAGGRMIE